MMLKNAIHIGDALTTLQKFPSESVHCIVTSPPYFALRDYGVPGQLGLEQSPDEYLDKLVAIFREARRVLRTDGTCWVNMGDSYATSPAGANPGGFQGDAMRRNNAYNTAQTRSLDKSKLIGYKPKDLMLIPFRLALALQADGYWVRQTNIWHKPSAMPSSVTDRTTTDFEYVFHLSKAAHYWYDSDAIREDAIHAGKYVALGDKSLSKGQALAANITPSGNALKDGITVGTTRNKRAVWTIPSEPYPDSHFATFPQALPELVIAAGCPATCCAKCGAGYVRVTEKLSTLGRTALNNFGNGELSKSARFGDSRQSLLGFQPSCTCGTDDTMPGVVLDMFGGAGTTALAAKHLGRDYVLIELNPRYVEMAQKRIRNYDPLQPTEFKDGSKQLSLFAELEA